jgi:stage V sporulation protein R
MSDFSQERRWHDDRSRIPDGQDRRKGRWPCRPLPPGPRPEHPLPDPSDWTFELITQYHEVIDRTARASAWTPTRTSWRSSPPSR